MRHGTHRTHHGQVRSQRSRIARSPPRHHSPEVSELHVIGGDAMRTGVCPELSTTWALSMRKTLVRAGSSTIRAPQRHSAMKRPDASHVHDKGVQGDRNAQQASSGTAHLHGMVLSASMASRRWQISPLMTKPATFCRPCVCLSHQALEKRIADLHAHKMNSVLSKPLSQIP